jgi:hypothetical protein
VAKQRFKPVLIFTKSSESAAALSKTIPGSRVIDEETGPLALRRAMVDHANGEYEVLIATPRWATGWKAPLGTKVIIQDDFPEELRDQALARVPGGSNQADGKN